MPIVLRILSTFGICRVEVDLQTTVGELHEILAQRTGVAPADQTLSKDAEGKHPLRPHRTLRRLGIPSGTRLYMHFSSSPSDLLPPRGLTKHIVVEDGNVVGRPQSSPNVPLGATVEWNTVQNEPREHTGDLGRSFRALQLNTRCVSRLPPSVCVGLQTRAHVAAIRFADAIVLNAWASPFIAKPLRTSLIGFMYGRFLASTRTVVVETIYSPPFVREGGGSRLVPGPDGRDVATIAASLGLERVGMIFTHPPRVEATDASGSRCPQLSASEVCEMARLQNEHMRGNNGRRRRIGANGEVYERAHAEDAAISSLEPRFVTIALSQSARLGELRLTACMVSDAAMALQRDGMLQACGAIEARRLSNGALVNLSSMQRWCQIRAPRFPGEVVPSLVQPPRHRRPQREGLRRNDEPPTPSHFDAMQLVVHVQVLDESPVDSRSRQRPQLRHGFIQAFHELPSARTRQLDARALHEHVVSHSYVRPRFGISTHNVGNSKRQRFDFQIDAAEELLDMNLLCCASRLLGLDVALAMVRAGLGEAQLEGFALSALGSVGYEEGGDGNVRCMGATGAASRRVIGRGDESVREYSSGMHESFVRIERSRGALRERKLVSVSALATRQGKHGGPAPSPGTAGAHTTSSHRRRRRYRASLSVTQGGKFDPDQRRARTRAAKSMRGWRKHDSARVAWH